VDGTRDAVVQFVVELRQGILLVDRRIGDITDSGSLDNVAHDELLDGLVLRARSSAVGAANRPHVASALLVPSVIASLGSHSGADLLKIRAIRCFC